MRVVFGIVSLLVVVAIVGILAKKQLSAASAPRTPDTTAAGTQPAATPRQQVEQFKQGVEGVMQQARPMPEDTK